MITFEKVNAGTKEVVKEMFASHGLETEDVQYCIKADDTYIGVIGYVVQDKSAQLSHFVIHFDYQGYGYGTNAYFTFEEMIKHRQIKEIKVAIQNVNDKARAFLEGVGFTLDENRYIKRF
ncbi:GNAT family N-acetyltransferase [Bacillus cytotoxicus]|uniref:GCN5-related N-acetyltransferase n=2 Tax=Bacillus cytotoxicus TaxID=580165 RepID=A0AAX2CG82_9BACI|nr:MULTISPECIES: GNAT family N-acetyltransferase [Bacillus cereus group]ABS21962.1 GCN5-related N-acetyltransferase [Bacillus cytotoxicus NVH 391-98]AWC28570.1 N-acetyltransferase [Bacillus cytotoxicus]AWC32590.1 N-acetyltransferase [Bacillus cytotoxicus]AWC36619.1 N-acetyltransferase [Bacillus cytotoxicus]AWC40047.1 N-acetyltransferase [Bacillus cytotoxicus]